MINGTKINKTGKQIKLKFKDEVCLKRGEKEKNMRKKKKKVEEAEEVEDILYSSWEKLVSESDPSTRNY